MAQKSISNGTVHEIPGDVRQVVLSKESVREIWEDITPLARNEWICWIEDAKKKETREKRIHVMLDKFKKGMRRPCCWAGCPHR